MKTVFTLLLICTSLVGYAQQTIGIKGGYTRAWEDYGSITLPDDAEIHISGFNVSALSYWRLSPHFSIGVEPGYVRRGAACEPGWWNDPNDPGFNGDARLLLRFVELPVLLMFEKQVFGDKFKLLAKSGFGAAYLVRAVEEETDLSGDGDPVATVVDLKNDERLNRFDYGFYGNLGLAMPLKNGNSIFLEGGYYHGLKDADQFNTSKNRNVSLSLGYMVEL